MAAHCSESLSQRDLSAGLLIAAAALHSWDFAR
jgi:hypothetical protein